MGHSNITMTLGTYGHLFDQAGTELADIMEGLREQHRGHEGGREIFVGGEHSRQSSLGLKRLTPLATNGATNAIKAIASSVALDALSRGPRGGCLYAVARRDSCHARRGMAIRWQHPKTLRSGVA